MRIGLLCLLAGTVVLLAALDGDAGAEVVFVPMLLIGLGIGALASQLGAVTVSAVSDDQAPEVGGIQNTMTNLGASIGTALAGSILIASLSSAFLTNIEASSAIPSRAKSQAQVQLAGGVPFISDADLEDALASAHVSGRTTRCRPRRVSRRPDHRATLRARDPRRHGDPLAVLHAADPGQAAGGILSAVFQKARGVSAAGRGALGERLGGFIYGTILSLAVLVGGVKAYPHHAWKIVVLLVVTATVFWLAHVYADSLAHVVAQDRHLSLAELRRIGRHESSILEAALPPLAPMLLAALGVISTTTGAWIAYGLGLGVLMFSGLVFARVERLGWLATLAVVALNVALGLVLVALKLVVTH